MSSATSNVDLFGGAHKWTAEDWTSSDDRVRGGASQSYLTCDSKTARFHGTLDIKTLGGAGFASQRTTGEDRAWDLSTYTGIVLDIAAADEKQYTFILKDELLPKSPNGREQSTISWEYDFTAEKGGQKVYISWSALKPTYRGKEKKDAKPLDLKNVKRISIMMRSFFGTQEGSFSLTIRSISTTTEQLASGPGRNSEAGSIQSSLNKASEENRAMEKQRNGWLGKLFGGCCVL